MLNLQADGQIDENEIVEQYRSGRFNGLFLRLSRGSRLRNLDFLARMPRIEYLEIEGRVVDDSAAFQVPGLRELVLLTKGEAAIPRGRNSSLSVLAFDDRGDRIDLEGFPSLTGLTIWSSLRRDLDFLGDVTELASFKLEGTGQILDLSGLDRCRKLYELEIVETRAKSLVPLGQLKRLRRCWLVGGGRLVQAEPLDFNDVSGLSGLEELRVTYGGEVRSVAPLLGMSSLRDVRLRGTTVVAGDSILLDEFPDSVTVVGPDG
ncbi:MULTISPECIES: hypothetical protein [Isoptericola]|uniref:hypothetical protein n=1 Tax=Isoptericola TaxID=254250 RepID=UPI000F650267|nr:MULTISPECIES: hypothetical protein [Isoptericola]